VEVLDVAVDQPGGAVERLGVELVAGAQSSAGFAVDQQDAFEEAVVGE
jgi:hypothetical protein